jgi:hypothetical protein
MKQSRLIIALAAALFMVNLAQAQVDVKINPIGLLFSNIDAAVEFGVKDNVGIELKAGYAWPNLNFGGEEDYTSSIVRLTGDARYYFNPSKGLDRFYAGAYAKYAGGKSTFGEEEITQTRVALGFLFGTKIVARNEKLLFDFHLGFGRALVSTFDSNLSDDDVETDDIPFLNWDIIGQLAIGYRF